MKKIINWIFKSKIDLSKKWWHRLLKVLFFLLIIVSAISLISFLSNVYTKAVHQWNYVDGFSSRLGKPPFSGKVASINDLYGENEVISDEFPSLMNSSLGNKQYLEPSSPLFLKDGQTKTFCSDELYKHIADIASANSTNLFSKTDVTYEGLYADVDAFTKYLGTNSYGVKCVMIDGFTITNEDGTPSIISFLRPIETYKYVIYSYEYNLVGFILGVLWSIALYLLFILCVLLLYYKVILYVIYGKIENPSTG